MTCCLERHVAVTHRSRIFWNEQGVTAVCRSHLVSQQQRIGTQGCASNSEHRGKDGNCVSRLSVVQGVMGYLDLSKVPSVSRVSVVQGATSARRTLPPLLPVACIKSALLAKYSDLKGVAQISQKVHRCKETHLRSTCCLTDGLTDGLKIHFFLACYM
jgi:hypothetical protein